MWPVGGMRGTQFANTFWTGGGGSVRTIFFTFFFFFTNKKVYKHQNINITKYEQATGYEKNLH